MKKEKETPNQYFQEALSDFVYDAACGRAIRHLADTGYTTAQIVNQLNYPTPFAKVQHTVTRHFKETGILSKELPVPPASLQAVILQRDSPEKLFSLLCENVRQNGEEHSYISCPFGDRISSAHLKSILTAREAEYISGILWEQKIMYHRLNRRMLEIGAQIAAVSKEVCFYFLKTGETFL